MVRWSDFDALSVEAALPICTRKAQVMRVSADLLTCFRQLLRLLRPASVLVGYISATIR